MRSAYVVLLYSVIFQDGTDGYMLSPCCARKIVGGLSYTLHKRDDVALTLGCLSDCVYKNDDAPGSNVCFARGDLESQCQDTSIPSSIFLTGGYDNGTLATTELYPASPGCSPPALPSPRHFHNTFITSFGLVATCGGRDSSNTPVADCLVLSYEGWEQDSRTPDLPEPRHRATSVTLPATGTFILGGQDTLNSSVLLRNGVSSWAPGPTLPFRGAAYACSVALGDSFLIIGGGPGEAFTQVQEYSVATGWAPADTWAQLTQERLAHGCAVIEDSVVVAGGYYEGTFLDTTEILSISGKTIRTGGTLSPARGYFVMAAIFPGTLYALGGFDASFNSLDTVEHWDQSSESWIMDTKLAGKNAAMGFLAVNNNLVCSKGYL